MKIKIVHILVIVCSLGAAYVSALLLQKHTEGTTSTSWFEAGCSDDTSSGSANCAAVLQSPYSYIPPKFPDQPKGGAHFPSAFVGLVYFSALAAWLIGVGRPSWQKRNVHLVPMTLVALGLLSSAYFIYIMYAKLDLWCPWCMVTHGLNLLIAIGLVLMRPRKPIEESSATTTIETKYQHPTSRVVFVTMAAVVAIAFAQLSLLGLRNWRKQAEIQNGSFNQCKTELDRIRTNAGEFVERWLSPPIPNFKLRPDDPTRGGLPAEQKPFHLVVFSDFECPMCRKVAVFIEESITPLFGGHLKVTFKHFPLHRDCNPRTKTKMHPHACEAAHLAEAARIVGGSDAFWLAHDYMYKNQSTLKHHGMTAAILAPAIGVDLAAMEQALGDTAIEKRINADIDLGLKSGLKGTPMLIINSRRVDSLVVRDIGFWDAMADNYWRSIGKPRPENTKHHPAASTPNNPGH